MNSLQDPNFILSLAIGVVTFLGSVIIPVLIYRKQRSRKGIAYELVSDAPVVHKMLKLRSSIEVRRTLNSEVLDNLNQLVIKFWNSGNQTIKKEDFDIPIQLIFNDQARVVSCGIVSDIPADLTIPDNQRVKLVIDSMNRKEDLILYVLVADYNEKIEYKAHITGGDFKEKKQGIISPQISDTISVVYLFYTAVILVFFPFSTLLDAENRLRYLGLYGSWISIGFVGFLVQAIIKTVDSYIIPRVIRAADAYYKKKYGIK
jgi:hypothetical protein